MTVKHSAASVALALALGLGLIPSLAFADDALGDVDAPNTPQASAAQNGSQHDAASSSRSDGKVTVSEDGTSASREGENFAVSSFSRAQKGSNRAIDGTYYGYSYLPTGYRQQRICRRLRSRRIVPRIEP